MPFHVFLRYNVFEITWRYCTCFKTRLHIQRDIHKGPKGICIVSSSRRDHALWTTKRSATPTYGRAKAGRPARTYLQQLCEDTGCNSEDLPEAMNDREKWRERVRDIRAGGTTWWWWYIISVKTCKGLFQPPCESLKLHPFTSQFCAIWFIDQHKKRFQGIITILNGSIFPLKHTYKIGTFITQQPLRV